jgi:hypothetical protein
LHTTVNRVTFAVVRKVLKNAASVIIIQHW